MRQEKPGSGSHQAVLGEILSSSRSLDIFLTGPKPKEIQV